MLDEFGGLVLVEDGAGLFSDGRIDSVWTGGDGGAALVR